MDLLRALSKALDRPLFPWKKIIVGFAVGQYLFENFLAWRQYKVLQRTKPPKVLEAEIDQETFDKSQAYGRAKAKFGFLEGIYGQVINLGIIFGDVYPKLWAFSGTWLARMLPASYIGQIPQSLLFLFLFNVVSTALSLPTSYYRTFVLEEEYGFNKQSVGLFTMDLLKTQLLGIAIGGPIISAFLAIIKKTGNDFFYWLWLFSVVVQMIMVTVYPILILPLFNKLTPLEAGPLKTGVENLAKRLKFPLTDLNVMDGSKRSAHSNAYFFGLPWKKHIVIYDTLIEKSESEEVVAVLGHELGHWSLSHTTKLMVISQFHMFYIFALFSAFINNKSLYQDFGFSNEFPIIVGFILFGEALAPMDTVVKLLMNILSRKFEFEADAFAQNLGYSTELCKSLIKLQIQNLSTMEADWMYASYHFSHPILSERLRALGWTQGAAKGQKKASEAPRVVKAADREL